MGTVAVSRSLTPGLQGQPPPVALSLEFHTETPNGAYIAREADGFSLSVSLTRSFTAAPAFLPSRGTLYSGIWSLNVSFYFNTQRCFVPTQFTRMNDWLWVNIFHISRRVVLYWETSELGGCVKVEVAVLGSPSLISLMVSVDVKQR